MVGIFPSLKEKVIDIFLNLKKDGRAIIFIEHDADLMSRLADRVILLDQGKIIADDLPDIVTNSPEFLARYRGQ